MATPNQPTDDATPERGTGQPNNEDRGRFLRALGLGYCTAGQHVALSAYEYGELGTWCLDHPCPSGPMEGPLPGYCEVGRMHFAKEGVYWMPKYAKWACPRHFAGIIADAIRRGTYGA